MSILSTRHLSQQWQHRDVRSRNQDENHPSKCVDLAKNDNEQQKTVSVESQTSTTFVPQDLRYSPVRGLPSELFAGSAVTEAGSTVHGARLVLEVADALVDGERPSQSCLQQQREIGRSARSEAGGSLV